MTYIKHKNLDLLVKWTPGHMGIIGNERADVEAKKATRDGLSLLIKLPAPIRKTLPWSKSAVKQEYTLKLKVAAIDLWNESIRHERMMWINLEFKHNTFIKLIHNLHQEQASLLFQLRMGHVPLNAYLHKIQKVNLLICPNCLQYNETVIHYILHCKKYKEERKTLFYKAGRDARNIGKLLSMSELLPYLFWYIKNTCRFSIHTRNLDAWHSNMTKSYAAQHNQSHLILLYSHTTIHILFHVGTLLQVMLCITGCRCRDWHMGGKYLCRYS